MNKEQLNEILEKHKKWLKGEKKGKRVNLSKANLFGANLFGADLSGANLSEANLFGADLSGANLSEANLFGADLSGANLSGADLSGANLSRADLSRANLSGANLSRADLSRAVFYKTVFYKTKRNDFIINKTPIKITGLTWVVFIFDEHMEIGCESHSFEDWKNFSDDKIESMDIWALNFWKKYKEILLKICDERKKDETVS